MHDDVAGQSRQLLPQRLEVDCQTDLPSAVHLRRLAVQLRPAGAYTRSLFQHKPLSVGYALWR